ncbi:MAG: AraC family transcriptional regulator [Bacteroidota bacterium]|nr:AraC family transcriptional regulator [Bacteroidota bacterium]
MSFWEFTPLLNKRKAGFLTKKLLLLFSFHFFYTIFLTAYYWLNWNESFKAPFVYAQLVPLALNATVIYLLIKNHKNLEGKSYQLTTPKNRDKYEKTGLSEAFSTELKTKLESLMENKKLYLNHDIRLDDIAELLNISRHHASQVINENFNVGFYDYINGYRIEEAKSILCSNFEKSSESISDIAYRCGFNNRVSFYKAFKKITRITPKEYIQKAA